MRSKDLEDKYERLKTTIAIVFGAFVIPSLMYGIHIDSTIWIENSLIIFFDGAFCTLLILFAEIRDFHRALRANASVSWEV